MTFTSARKNGAGLKQGAAGGRVASMWFGTGLLPRFRGNPDRKLRAGRVWGHVLQSLRTKGLIAFVALMVYIALVGTLVAYQRDRLHHMVEQQEMLSRVDAALARVTIALTYSLIHEDEADTLKSHLTLDNIDSDMKAIQVGLQGLRERYPGMATRIAGLNGDIDALRAASSHVRLVDSHEKLHDIAHDLEDITRGVSEDYRALSEHFRTSYDSITLISLSLGLIGAVVFGSVVASFFSRLVWDIRKLQARAREVATGYRGQPIEVTRRDELGSLMEAVNRMQAALAEREKQIEISRQRHFHHEKMATVGSLAAAVAHEINNPIAAITGIAQSINVTKQSNHCPQALCRPEMILEHTRRIAQITRQVAELTVLQSPEPALLDLNGLVQNTSTFVSYDRRFHRVNLVLELDRNLPAVRTVADHVTQVLMNLLINAADALEGAIDRKPTIRVATRAGDNEVLIAVSDNGHGMDHAVLSQVFQESFTTKPLGKGRGLGLFLCKTLIEENGGRIELESAPDAGTTARIHLPLQHTTGA